MTRRCARRWMRWPNCWRDDPHRRGAVCGPAAAHHTQSHTQIRNKVGQSPLLKPPLLKPNAQRAM